MRVINLRGVDYDYPEGRDDGWGDIATDYASAIASAINDIAPDSDVLDTFVTGLIEDDAFHILPLFTLNPSLLAGARADLMVYRAGGSETQVIMHNISFFRDYDANQWDFTIDAGGKGAGQVEFAIDHVTGQLSYKANDLGSSSFHMRFRVYGMPA